MDRIVEIMKSASDPTRIRILMALSNGELCVCQITAFLELAPSTVSKHMSILKHAGFVQSRKEGKWIYYKLKEISSDTTLRKILNILEFELNDTEQIKADQIKIKKVLEENQEELCARICCRKTSK